MFICLFNQNLISSVVLIGACRGIAITLLRYKVNEAMFEKVVFFSPENVFSEVSPIPS